MMKLKMGLVICLTLIASSCSTVSINRADIAAANQDLRVEVSDPVKVKLRDVDVDCDRQTGMCTMSREDANYILDLITKLAGPDGTIDELNKAVSSLTTGHNKMVDNLIECEYGSAVKSEVIKLMERQGMIKDVGSVIKQVAIGGACALLLK